MYYRNPVMCHFCFDISVIGGGICRFFGNKHVNIYLHNTEMNLKIVEEKIISFLF